MADAFGSQCAEHGSWSGDHQAVRRPTSLCCLSRIGKYVAKRIAHELHSERMRGWKKENPFPGHRFALVLAGGKSDRQMDRRQVHRWWSCSTRCNPSAHARARRLAMAGFSHSCDDLILIWRMRLPLPTSNPSGSGTKPPKKKPRFKWFSNTMMYKIRSNPESVGPYPKAS